MIRFSLSFRLIAAVFFTSALVAIGVLNVCDRAAWVDAYDGVFWVETEHGLTAETAAPNGPGYSAGIRVGDRLLAVNDKKTPDLGIYAESLYIAGPGARLNYTVLTAGGVQILPVSLAARHLFTVWDGVKTLLAFLHLGIGVFVALRATDEAEKANARRFYFLCLAAFVLWITSYTPALGAMDLFVYAISAVAFLILPAILIHFCTRFAAVSTGAGNRPTAVRNVYALSGIFCLIHLLWATGNLAPLGIARTVSGGALIDRIETAYFGAAFLAAGWILLKRHLWTNDIIARQQLKWIGCGVLAGTVPFVLIYIIPMFFGARTSFILETSALFLALIPLSIGYAVLRYRLMDVEDIARRSAACLLTAAMLLLIPVVSAFILNESLRELPPRAAVIVTAMTALTLALLFAPLRRVIQTRLDCMFYRNYFKYRRTLLDFARALGAELSLEPLARNISERLVRAFPVNRAAVLIADPARPDFFRFVAGINCAASAKNLFLRAKELDETVAFNDLPETGASFGLVCPKNGPEYLCGAGAALSREGFSYRQDIYFQGRRIGTMALGELPSGGHFSGEDLELLSAMAGYCAIALENAALYHSEQTHAAESARLKNFTENILESIDVAVVAVASDGSIRSCNRAFETMYGAARHEITGSSAENLLSSDVVASIRSAAAMTGWDAQAPADIFKLYMKNLNGRRLIVNLNVRPLRQAPKTPFFAGNSGGSPAFPGFSELALRNPAGISDVFTDEADGCLLVMEDITERTRLEEQLLQAEKLSSIGLLAAGVAHEINTPLTGISSYTQMLLKDAAKIAETSQTTENERRKAILEKIEKQTFRAAEIVGGLLSFSRLGGSDFSVVDINQIIHDSLSLLDHQFDRSRVKVARKLYDALPAVYGNTGKLQQVFVNLFLNARDAMPSGGELGIQTGMDNSMVVVDISDTGGGISGENLKRIFDPFFTTKGIGKGTGLGLAVSYGIIQEHGGGIFVESAAGKGTRFTLKLPARLN